MCFNLLKIECTYNRNELQKIITYINQYTYRFQNKRCINSIHSYTVHRSMLALSFSLAIYFPTISFTHMQKHCTLICKYNKIL